MPFSQQMYPASGYPLNYQQQPPFSQYYIGSGQQPGHHP